MFMGENDANGGEKIVRMVALETWKCQNKVKWVEDLKDG